MTFIDRKYRALLEKPEAEPFVSEIIVSVMLNMRGLRFKGCERPKRYTGHWGHLVLIKNNEVVFWTQHRTMDEAIRILDGLLYQFQDFPGIEIRQIGHLRHKIKFTWRETDEETNSQ